jgi:hypothetical protein
MAQNKLRIKGVGTSNPVDADAQAFITAAGITDTTQKSAINTLVVNLKAYGIWTKMKAIYPMVGGTATQHKWNLKDPRDLDAAFRLVFNGGWVHSSTGAKPNGTNAFANTALNPSSALTLNSTHLSFYSRTNISAVQREIAIYQGGDNPTMALGTSIGAEISDHYNYGQRISVSIASSTGFYIGTRTSSTSHKLYKNNTTLGTNTSTNVNSLPNGNLFIGASNNTTLGIISSYSTKECAFSSIGDGLTDTEAANFYTAVQAFQTTLGRSIGTQTVSDADAQAFVTNAGIVDQVEATAVNNLVTGLKADSLWTKMKALYPFVGGTASSHKFNLKDPRDLNAAFRLTFSGGWTHSSTGALPNGSNAYANTSFTPSVNGTGLNNLHIGYYSRTNNSSGGGEMGIYGPPYTLMFVKWTNNNAYFGINGTYPEVGNTNSGGLFVASRINSTTATLYRNNSKLLAASSTSTSAPSYPLFIGAVNATNGTGPAYYTNRECAFATIGDGLTDAEATNFYNRVQTFQTALNRNV